MELDSRSSVSLQIDHSTIININQIRFNAHLFRAPCLLGIVFTTIISQVSDISRGIAVIFGRYQSRYRSFIHERK